MVALVALGVAFVVVRRKQRQADQGGSHLPTTTNPNLQQQSAPTVGGDIGDAYEPAQTLNPDYQPMLPERMRNRVYAEINLNVAGVPGHPDRQQDEYGYVAMHMPPTPDRLTDSSA